MSGYALSSWLPNGDGQPRDSSGSDDAGRCPVRDDYAPAPGAPKAHCPAPAIRCDSEEGDFKPVAGDVGVWAAGVAGDGRDDAEDVPSGRDRNESQVEVKVPGVVSLAATEIWNLAKADAQTMSARVAAKTRTFMLLLHRQRTLGSMQRL